MASRFAAATLVSNAFRLRWCELRLRARKDTPRTASGQDWHGLWPATVQCIGIPTDFHRKQGKHIRQQTSCFEYDTASGQDDPEIKQTSEHQVPIFEYSNEYKCSRPNWLHSPYLLEDPNVRHGAEQRGCDGNFHSARRSRLLWRRGTNSFIHQGS